MIKSGILINILIDTLISLVSLIFIHSLYKKYYECNDKTRPSQMSLMIFWAMISIYFIVDAIRQLIAASGNFDLQLQLYLLSLFPLTLLSLPIVFIIIYIVSGNKYVGAGVSSVFLLFSFLYIFTVIQMKQIDITFTPFGSLVFSNNEFAITVFLSGLFIVPTSMILGLLTLIFLKHISPFKKYQICLSLLSISIVYDFLFLTTITQSGEIMLGYKIFIFLGVTLGYFANFPPKIIEYKWFPEIPIID